MSQRDDGYIALATEVDGETATPPTTRPLENGERTRTFARGGTFTFEPGGTGYSYAYGPGGVAGLRHNHYALASATFASIGGLLFGYDQGVIANVLVMKDFRDRWAMSDWQEGLMTAMLELGALVGALLAGVFADRYSRRHSIFIACIVFSVGSTFQFAARSLEELILGRAIGGVGIGSLSMLSPLYMAEISPPEVRGSLMALEQLAIVLGVVFGFWTGFFTRGLHESASWRVPLAIQVIPAVVLALGCLILPPSPRLLIFQGKHGDALNALHRLRLRQVEGGDTEMLVKLEYLEMQVEAYLISRSSLGATHKNPLVAELESWKRLFSHKYVDRTMIGIMIMFFQQWSGINALIYYGPLLMRRIGLQGDIVELLGSGGIGIVQFVAVVPAILYIDRLGRKPLLQLGGVVMGMAHLFIAILVNLYQDDWPSHHFAAWSAVACTYLFTAAYGLSFGPIAWVLPSEVLPLSIRSKGAALSTASNWTNNFFIGLVTPAFLSKSPTGTFVVFAIACFSASIWSKIFVPETANVSLEEIDKLFRSDISRDDAELRREIMREIGLDSLIHELSMSDGMDL